MYTQQVLAHFEDSTNPLPDMTPLGALRQASHAERGKAVRRIMAAITQRTEDQSFNFLLSDRRLPHREVVRLTMLPGMISKDG